MRVWIVGATLTALIAVSPAAASGLKAAAVKVDITPDSPQWLLGYGARRSEGVHDRIYHRILALDDGEQRFVLVSSGLCLISPREYENVAARLAERTGVARISFWWSATHTHSAPEVGPPGLPAAFLGDRYAHEPELGYTAWVEQRLLEGVEQALAELEPAHLALGWGFSLANINRRARDVEGETRLGMNPQGPTDRRIGLLRFETPHGSPIALLANYPIHGTVLGGANLEISGDAPGVAAAYVEEQLGAPMVFLNGAAGDQAPLYSVYPDARSGHLSEFRRLLGEPILEANARMRATIDEVELSASEIVLETPMRSGLQWPAELADYVRDDAGRTLIRLPIRLLRLNDEAAIWSAPLELFSRIAVRVRERSPFAYTFYGGYTNGWLGYLLTAEEWPHGGYETRVSPFQPDAQFQLERTVGAALDSLAVD